VSANPPLGISVARALRGSWRKSPSAKDPWSGELSDLLRSTGAGVLAARRLGILPSDLKEQRQNAFMNHDMQARILDICTSRLNEAGIASLVFKGWAISACYAEPECRPTGDADILIAPGRMAEALALLQPLSHQRDWAPIDPTAEPIGLTMDMGLPAKVSKLDLHLSLGKFRIATEEAFAMAEARPCVDHVVKVLGPAHHLRLLVLHMFRHGAWRPIWLVDIAAMLENLPQDFDWDRATGGDPVVQNWVSIAAGLARDLLGADLDELPPFIQNCAVPAWIKAHIIAAWSRPFSAYHTRPALKATLRLRPWAFPAELAARWPDPLRAPIETARPFRGRPGRGLQARAAMQRLRA